MKLLPSPGCVPNCDVQRVPKCHGPNRCQPRPRVVSRRFIILRGAALHLPSLHRAGSPGNADERETPGSPAQGRFQRATQDPATFPPGPRLRTPRTPASWRPGGWRFPLTRTARHSQPPEAAGRSSLPRPGVRRGSAGGQPDSAAAHESGTRPPANRERGRESAPKPTQPMGQPVVRGALPRPRSPQRPPQPRPRPGSRPESGPRGPTSLTLIGRERSILAADAGRCGGSTSLTVRGCGNSLRTALAWRDGHVTRGTPNGSRQSPPAQLLRPRLLPRLRGGRCAEWGGDVGAHLPVGRSLPSGLSSEFSPQCRAPFCPRPLLFPGAPSRGEQTVV